ncbi:MAG: TatD family hydrolase [Candidatus Aenigmatarchaeota archaeon]
MIDVHCHLEQRDYDSDRDEVIEKCKQELKAVITSCARPKDLDLTMQLVEKHRGFVFATVGIHPQYIKKINEKEKEEFFEIVRKNKDKIVGIGEVGLDFLIEETEWREKQKELFSDFISLSNELKKPLIIHARKAFDEAIEILDAQKAKNVLMHFFSAKELLDRVIENGWYISVNTTLLTSKNIKKIVRDMPIERILTETDSPWLGSEGKRNDPRSIKLVIQRISEIKKVGLEEIDKLTTENAIKFFDLKV